jgi:hypothetical protein
MSLLRVTLGLIAFPLFAVELNGAVDGEQRGGGESGESAQRITELPHRDQPVSYRILDELPRTP